MSESDVKITKLSLQEELNEAPDIHCAMMLPNKMSCPKKAIYKRVVKTIPKNSNMEPATKVDYLCEGHYQLLISNEAGKKYKVRH